LLQVDFPNQLGPIPPSQVTAGEQFSEVRLRQFVRGQARNFTPIILDGLDEALRNWRGSETLTDDLSVLMLDRLSERTIDAHL
jgi:hypothetical protein